MESGEFSQLEIITENVLLFTETLLLACVCFILSSLSVFVRLTGLVCPLDVISTHTHAVCPGELQALDFVPC